MIGSSAKEKSASEIAAIHVLCGRVKTGHQDIEMPGLKQSQWHVRQGIL
jgi:hypothetical protein